MASTILSCTGLLCTLMTPNTSKRRLNVEVYRDQIYTVRLNVVEDSFI